MLKNIILIVVLSYAGLNIFALLFSTQMIFLPPRSGYHDSARITKLTLPNGTKISAIYLPNKKAKYTILVSHGNAEDIGYMYPFLQAIQAHGFAVFAYDYPGYGTSEGRATEKTTYMAVIAAYDYLTQKLKVPATRIISYGRSVGAAMAIELATKRKVAGVIAQSPFVTAFRVMTQIPLLLFDKFTNIKKIKQINCPLLVIHGTADAIIPLWHGRRLYETALEPKYKLWVKGAGHNNLIQVANDDFWQAIKAFATKCG
jgi:abhydrolase domain-containing protein 17